MIRLTKKELDRYLNDGGLTNLQKTILKRRFFDDDNTTIISLCLELHISESTYYRAQRSIFKQICKLDKLT